LENIVFFIFLATCNITNFEVKKKKCCLERTELGSCIEKGDYLICKGNSPEYESLGELKQFSLKGKKQKMYKDEKYEIFPNIRCLKSENNETGHQNITEYFVTFQFFFSESTLKITRIQTLS
jgi:hypothetical protein